MKKSIISAKIFPRRVAESAEKGQEKGLNFRILSASSAPLREYFSWCGFGCGWPRCEIRGKNLRETERISPIATYRVTLAQPAFSQLDGLMNTFLKWVLVPAAALALGAVCHGQVIIRAGVNTNAALQRPPAATPPTLTIPPIPPIAPIQPIAPIAPTVLNAGAGPAHTLTGTVYDPSGMPAPGARLQVLPLSVQNPQIVSDANGKYALSWHPLFANSPAAQARVYTLIARDMERNFAAARAIDETATNLDIDLQWGLTLSAPLQDPNGKPITNAVTSLVIYSGTIGSLIAMPSVKPDDRGVIRIPALPQGCRYSVRVTAPGYGSASSATLLEADTRTTSLVLPAVALNPATLKLAGQVLGTDGTPAIAARVNISGSGQPVSNTVTDATGHFDFNVCEGTVSILANGTGAVARAHVMATGGDTNLVLRLTNNSIVRPAAAATPPAARNGVLTRTTQMITGAVLDPSGAPVPGVAVAIMPRSGSVQGGVSDANGKFTLASTRTIPMPTAAAVAINYWLVARDSERNLAAIAKIDSQTTNMDLRLQPGLTLSGSVFDNNGAPVKTATVQVALTEAGLLYLLGGPLAALAGGPPAAVNDQGVFNISALPRGKDYRLTVAAAGFGSDTVTLRSTDKDSLQLQPIFLKPADRPLEGMVLDPDGFPAAGVMVQISGAGVGQPAANTRSDANGRFALKACEGAVRLVASVTIRKPNGVVLGTGTVQTQGGDTNIVIKLTAPEIGIPAAPLRNGLPPTNTVPTIGPFL
jgi:protocatechuate 3,4-dioxygenase beta subunit